MTEAGNELAFLCCKCRSLCYLPIFRYCKHDAAFRGVQLAIEMQNRWAHCRPIHFEPQKPTLTDGDTISNEWIHDRVECNRTHFDRIAARSSRTCARLGVAVRRASRELSRCVRALALTPEACRCAEYAGNCAHTLLDRHVVRLVAASCSPDAPHVDVECQWVPLAETRAKYAGTITNDDRACELPHRRSVTQNFCCWGGWHNHKWLIKYFLKKFKNFTKHFKNF